VLTHNEFNEGSADGVTNAKSRSEQNGKCVVVFG